MNFERKWKDQLYQEFARIGKCLSSPKRLELIDLLTQGPKSVEQLSKITGMSVANVSQHLQTLYDSRLVRFTKKGNYVIYEITQLSIAEFMVSLHRLSEKQLFEIQQLKAEVLQHHESLEPISLEQLVVRMNRGDVLQYQFRLRNWSSIYHPYQRIKELLLIVVTYYEVKSAGRVSMTPLKQREPKKRLRPNSDKFVMTLRLALNGF